MTGIGEFAKFVNQDYGTVFGDNYHYASANHEYCICVGWALHTSYNTTVFVDGKITAEFLDKRYVLPEEALSRIGVKVLRT